MGTGLNGSTETPEQVAQRVACVRAAAQAVAERLARFPVLTAENVAEATAWQEARVRELLTLGITSRPLALPAEE
jgi:hypothetical protein